MVVSIIARLIAILLPALGKARSQARNSLCKSNLRQQAIGGITYEQDYGVLMLIGKHLNADGTLPEGGNVSHVDGHVSWYTYSVGNISPPANRLTKPTVA